MNTLGVVGTRDELIAEVLQNVRDAIARNDKYLIIEAIPYNAGLSPNETYKSGILTLIRAYKFKLEQGLKNIKNEGGSIEEVEALAQKAGFPPGGMTEVIARADAAKKSFPMWALYAVGGFILYRFIRR